MSYPSYWRNFKGVVEKNTFRASTLIASDGHPLTIYEAGDIDRDAVVIVSPVASPFLVMARIAESLARRFRVISWEVRGSTFLDEDCDSCCLSLERHAQDLQEILASRQVGRVHYVTWCGGAWIAYWALMCRNVPGSSVFSIAPNCLSEGEEKTPFDEFIMPLLRRAVQADPPTLESIYKILQGGTDNRACKSKEEKDLYEITDLRIESPRAIRQLAKLFFDFVALPASYGCESLGGRMTTELFDTMCGRLPVVLVHARDDQYVNYSCSLAAVARNPRTKLILYPEGVGGHFIPFLDYRAICSDIENLIDSTTRITSLEQVGQEAVEPPPSICAPAVG
jgi:pimeloyl-ACP methyl ester carboxylesterase